MTLAFTAYGAARPQGSHRAFLPKGARFPVVTDDNRGLKSWRLTVAAAAGVALAALPDDERQLVTGGVRCELWFFLPRPKKYTTPKHCDAHIPHTTKPDLDKLTRAVCDALTHVVWRDDAQVVELLTAKKYAAVNTPARVDVRVSSVAPSVSSLFEVDHA